MNRASEDLQKLFEKIPMPGFTYQEVRLDENVRKARTRWPIIDAIESHREQLGLTFVPKYEPTLMGIPHVEERPDVEQHGENLETEPSGTTTLQSVFQRLSYIPEIEQYSENHPERTPSTTPIQDTFLRLSPCGSPSSTTENNGPQDTAIQRILFRLTNETNPSGDVPPPPGSDLQRTFSRLTHRM